MADERDTDERRSRPSWDADDNYELPPHVVENQRTARYALCAFIFAVVAALSSLVSLVASVWGAWNG